jgi:Uma2 family endonuclease
MEEHRANGTRLGWLIDPDHRRVAVYRADGSVIWHEQPAVIAGDPVLPGFVLHLTAIWEPAW